MKITYKPKRENAKPAHTNLGTFAVGETKLIGEADEREAKRLIKGGDFVEGDGKGPIAKAAAAVKDAVTGDATTAKKK